MWFYYIHRTPYDRNNKTSARKKQANNNRTNNNNNTSRTDEDRHTSTERTPAQPHRSARRQNHKTTTTPTQRREQGQQCPVNITCMKRTDLEVIAILLQNMFPESDASFHISTFSPSRQATISQQAIPRQIYNTRRQSTNSRTTRPSARKLQ